MSPLDAYVRDLADRMGLRDWTLRVDLEDPDSPPRTDGQQWGASVEAIPGRKYGVIKLGQPVLDSDPDEQRATIVHELVHLHFGAMTDQVRNDLDDYLPGPAYRLFEASFTRNMEYGVDALAEVIAPHMPLPEKDGD